MYYIYFKRPNNNKFRAGENIFLKSIDEYTTRCVDRNHLLSSTTCIDVLPLDLSKEAYIWKQTEDENVDMGEVLYSDCADICDVDAVKERIINRFDNKENMPSFLEKYLELSYGKGTNEEVIKEARRILELLDEKKDRIFPFIQEYFKVLMDTISKDYESYRFAYLADKVISKKKVKCMTKNIIGKRKIH